MSLQRDPPRATPTEHPGCADQVPWNADSFAWRRSAAPSTSLNAHIANGYRSCPDQSAAPPHIFSGPPGNLRPPSSNCRPARGSPHRRDCIPNVSHNIPLPVSIYEHHESDRHQRRDLRQWRCRTVACVKSQNSSDKRKRRFKMDYAIATVHGRIAQSEKDKDRPRSEERRVGK